VRVVVVTGPDREREFAGTTHGTVVIHAKTDRNCRPAVRWPYLDQPGAEPAAGVAADSRCSPRRRAQCRAQPPWVLPDE
jgi:hypothetical protein